MSLLHEDFIETRDETAIRFVGIERDPHGLDPFLQGRIDRPVFLRDEPLGPLHCG
jgi:hypothetical protein